MTADCISRERREGTLGLLFLTPLTVLDVIAGKAAIHVLRALTLFLAALPVLVLPLVLGGVEWRWVLMAAVVQANAVLIPAAAGYRDDRSARQAAVFVVENGRALRRQVRIGRERDSLLEIVAGLKGGDLLIADQSIELADGVRVVER